MVRSEAEQGGDPGAMAGPDPAPPPPSPERLIRMAWGFAAPLMIQAAVQLDLFDDLVGGASSLADLAARTGASPRGLAALLDGLVGLALLRKDEAGRYELVPESAQFLVRGRPEYHGHYVQHIATALLPDWLRIGEAVRSGHPTGSIGPDALPSDRLADAVRAMFAPNYPAARSLGEHLGVGRDGRALRVLDIGAGSAVWSIALAQMSAAVRVTAVDRGPVLDVAAREIARLGLLPRYSLVAGDPLEVAFEPGQDIALLGHVLHACSPGQAQALLAHAFAALRPGGVLAIAEYMVDWRRTEPAISLVFAVNMLIRSPGGTAYAFEEIRAWLDAAGFADIRVFDAPAPSPLVLANRPA